MEYSEVCELLDTIALEYLTTLEEILQYTSELEKTVRNGYWFMSKARSIMGNKAVSELQIPVDKKMTSVIQVDVEETELFSAQVPGIAAILKNEYKKFAMKNSCENELDLEKYGMRRRKNEAENMDAAETLASECGTSNNDNSKSTPKSVEIEKPEDTIKWFGILVPQSLRQSQTVFKSALEMTVELTNKKSKLEALRAQYAQLIKFKKELKKQHCSTPLQNKDDVTLPE